MKRRFWVITATFRLSCRIVKIWEDHKRMSTVHTLRVECEKQVMKLLFFVYRDCRWSPCPY